MTEGKERIRQGRRRNFTFSKRQTWHKVIEGNRLCGLNTLKQWSTKFSIQGPRGIFSLFSPG